MPILFTSDLPGTYELDQIYHPDDNPSGQIIPRPNSLVIDPTTGVLQRVVSVHPTTFISTYGPVSTQLFKPEVVVEETSDVSFADYGNSRFYLFYDKSETPTKLVIDRKVVVIGSDAKDFEIVKWDETSKEYVPISLYYDTDGIYQGTKIPLENNGSSNSVKVPTNCHTTINIQDEEIFYIFVYDYAGTQCSSLKLFAKRAVVNNVLEDTLIVEDISILKVQKQVQRR